MTTPALIDYIKTELNSGVSRESLEKLLLTHGWTSSDIEMAFTQIEAFGGISTRESEEIAEETAAMRQSRTALILGATSLIAWIIPPAGAATGIYGMRYAMQALAGVARRQAVAAIILSAIGLGTTALFTFVLLFLAASGQSARITSLFGLISREEFSPAQMHDQRFQSYMHPTLDFSLDIPKGWIRDESGASGLAVSFFNPRPDFHGSQEFSAQLSVAESEERLGFTLPDYADENETLLTRSIAGYTQRERRLIQIEGIDALLVSGSFPLGDMTIRNIRLFILTKEKLSIISALALADRWDAYRDEFETSLHSFRQ